MAMADGLVQILTSLGRRWYFNCVVLNRVLEVIPVVRHRASGRRTSDHDLWDVHLLHLVDERSHSLHHIGCYGYRCRILCGKGQVVHELLARGLDEFVTDFVKTWILVRDIALDVALDEAVEVEQCLGIAAVY